MQCTQFEWQTDPLFEELRQDRNIRSHFLKFSAYQNLSYLARSAMKPTDIGLLSIRCKRSVVMCSISRSTSEAMLMYVYDVFPNQHNTYWIKVFCTHINSNGAITSTLSKVPDVSMGNVVHDNMIGKLKGIGQCCGIGTFDEACKFIKVKFAVLSPAALTIGCEVRSCDGRKMAPHENKWSPLDGAHESQVTVIVTTSELS